jgi:hypothetical protein
MKEPGNTLVLADVIEWLDTRSTGANWPGTGSHSACNTSLLAGLRAQGAESLAQAAAGKTAAQFSNEPQSSPATTGNAGPPTPAPLGLTSETPAAAAAISNAVAVAASS